MSTTTTSATKKALPPFARNGVSTHTHTSAINVSADATLHYDTHRADDNPGSTTQSSGPRPRRSSAHSSSYIEAKQCELYHSEGVRAAITVKTGTAMMAMHTTLLAMRATTTVNMTKPLLQSSEDMQAASNEWSE
jgi:hypothetical protein